MSRRQLLKNVGSNIEQVLAATQTVQPKGREAIFVVASHQTRLDTRSKARSPIKVGIKGRGRSGTSRDSNPASH